MLGIRRISLISKLFLKKRMKLFPFSDSFSKLGLKTRTLIVMHLLF